MENYTITKEQILETIRTGTDVTERYFKEIIPEAFKKELEIGKWYKYKLALFYVTNKISNNANYYNIFGFDVDGNWMTHNAKTYFDENYIEATPEEVEVALINEAKKRGFVEGAKFKSTISEKGQIRTVTEKRNWDFYLSYNSLNTSTPKTEWYNFNTQLQSNPTIFRDGKWAQILPQEKTVVPMAKALKIIAKKMKVSPENIEIQY